VILPLTLGLALGLSAVRTDPDVAQGLALYQGLDFDRAVVALQRALTKKEISREDRAKALETLAFAYTVLGDSIHAEHTFHVLLDEDPGYNVDPDLSPRLRSAFVQAKSTWIEGRRIAFAITSPLDQKELAGRLTTGDPERVGTVVARGDSGRIFALACQAAECRGERPDEPFYVDVRDHKRTLLFTIGPFTPEVKEASSSPTWWLWLAAGAAAVGGGVALGLALHKGEPPAGTLGRLQLP
jgi:hypothetical protein